MIKFLLGILIASCLIIFAPEIKDLLIKWEVRDDLVEWLNSWEKSNDLNKGKNVYLVFVAFGDSSYILSLFEKA